MYAVTNYKEMGIAGEAIQIYEDMSAIFMESIPSEFRIENQQQDHSLGATVVRLKKAESTSKYRATLNDVTRTTTEKKQIEDSLSVFAEKIKKEISIFTNSSEENTISVLYTPEHLTIKETKQTQKKDLGVFNIDVVDQAYPKTVSLNNYIIAQGEGSTIYLHALPIFNAVYAESFILLIKFVVEEFIACKEGNISINMETLKVLVNKVIREKTNELTKIIKDCEEALKSALEQVVENTQKIERGHAGISALKITESRREEFLLEELRKIHMFEEVKNVIVTNEIIIIETHPIIASIPGKESKYIFGRYKIMINLKTGAISATNKDFYCGGRHHPHMHDNGFCWGNISKDLASSIAQLELSITMTLLFNFLSTANPKDAWGSTYANWPYINKENKIVFSNTDYVKNKAVVNGMPLEDYLGSCK